MDETPLTWFHSIPFGTTLRFYKGGTTHYFKPYNSGGLITSLYKSQNFKVKEYQGIRSQKLT
jgi:hypothetical protein